MCPICLQGITIVIVQHICTEDQREPFHLLHTKSDSLYQILLQTWWVLDKKSKLNELVYHKGLISDDFKEKSFLQCQKN